MASVDPKEKRVLLNAFNQLDRSPDSAPPSLLRLQRLQLSPIGKELLTHPSILLLSTHNSCQKSIPLHLLLPKRTRRFIDSITLDPFSALYS